MCAALQFAFLFIASLMKDGTIPVKGKALSNILVIISFIFLIPYLAYTVTYAPYTEKIVWSDVKMIDEIPQPNSKRGYIYTNTNDSLNMDVNNISKSAYDKYVEECKNYGYTIDGDVEADGAFNDEGYKLKLYYYEYSKEMELKLEAPIKLASYSFPSGGYADLIPKPQSNIGRTERNNANALEVLIGETDQLAFSDYVDECMAAGFTVDYDRSDTLFTARNDEGYRLTVSYIGYNIMNITVSEKEYDVTINLDFDSDSEDDYDVFFYIDDDYIDYIYYESSETYHEVLTEGTHTLRFENDDDYNMDTTYIINVTEAGEVSLRVVCDLDSISVEEVSK